VSSANQRSRRGISVRGSMKTRLRLRRSRLVPKPTPEQPTIDNRSYGRFALFDVVDVSFPKRFAIDLDVSFPKR